MSGLPTTAESATAAHQVLVADVNFVTTSEDVAERERLIAPEFVNISFDGQLRARAQQVEAWRTTRRPPRTRDSDRHVRIYGRVAIVTARQQVAPDWADSGVLTRVWLQRNHRWQLVLSQNAGNLPADRTDVAEAVSTLQGEERAVFRC